MDFETALNSIRRLAADLADRGYDKLPAERQLAERLSTSRSVVRRVLDLLESQGVLRRVRGRTGGSFLVDAPQTAPEAAFDEDAVQSGRRPRLIQRDLDVVVGVPEMLQTQGFVSGTRLVAASFDQPTAEELGLFRLDASEPVISVQRLRFADGDSLSLETFRMPANRFPGILESPLTGSLYELLARDFDVMPAAAHEQIMVAFASPRTAAALGIEVGSPLLKVIRTGDDQFGVCFEHSVDLFRADRTALTATGRRLGVHPRAQHALRGEPRV